MKYYYDGHLRFQFLMDSPNYCATVLGMAVLILCGFLACFPSKTIPGRIAYLSVFLLTAFGILGVALTYSRGGWVALAAGMIVVWVGAPRIRRPVSLLLGIFVVSIFLMPGGVNRTLSYADQTDLSILNRLEVWKGALAMLADNWQSGIGKDNFGSEFALRYQPPSMSTSYYAALNDYLTLAARYGVFALWTYLFCIMAPWATAWNHAKRRGDILIVGLLAAQVVFFVSGLFTYALTIWTVSIWFALLYLSVLAYIVSLWFGKKERFLWKKSVNFAALSALLSAVALGAGDYFSSKLPTTLEYCDITINGKSVPMFIAAPRNANVNGSVLYYKEKGTRLEDNAHYVLRELGAKGFIAAAPDYAESGLPGLEDVKSLNEWFEKNAAFDSAPRFIAGKGLGARLAIVSMCLERFPKVQGVAAIESEAQWPFPDISPEARIQYLSCPLLIVHREGGGGVPLSEAFRLKELCDENGRQSELMTYKINRKNPKYLPTDAIERISMFFLQQTSNQNN